MKSVLEALGGKRQSSPRLQSAPSPTSMSESAKFSNAYNNVPVSQTSVYQPVPVLVATAPESNASASHYDVPRITTTQHPSMLPRTSMLESKPAATSKPIPNPRQSPSQSRSSQCAVSRPVSSVSVENVYDVPRASNNQPLSPIGKSHYDIPRITSQLPASKSHYDVPRQQAVPTQQTPGCLPRTLSDTDLTTDTIKVPATLPRAYTPPVTPRRFGNDKAKTLEGSANYKDMQQYKSDATRKDSKKKPQLLKRRQS